MSEGVLKIAVKKKRNEKQRRKGKISHLNAEFQRIARRDLKKKKKPSSVISAKK